MEYSAKKYVIEREYPLSKERVWKLLSDTDRLNRFIGLFPVQFTPVQKNGDEVFFRTALAKVAGVIPLSWQEYPFQWVENESYVVERHYQGGPLKHFVGGVELLDADNGSELHTKVRLFGEFTPRNLLGIAAIPITGLRSMQNTIAYIDDFLRKNKDDAEIKLPDKSTTHKVNLTELKRLEATLHTKPVDSSCINYLHRFIVESSDLDVAKMRPIPIAKQWGVNADQVLRLFLYATKVGILNLSWNLICPNCRVSKAEYSSLSHLQSNFHCDLCGINYDANFAKYVELYFTVHPAIRKATDQTYCVGGPMITPHVKVQKIIKRGASFQLNIPKDNDSLRLRVIQANHTVAIDTDGVPDDSASIVQYHNNGWSTAKINTTPITIHNASSNDIVMVLERAEWSDEVITAAKVTAMQEFRDLFSSEVLAPGQQVGIENVTILFSDLQGSTSLYEMVGDANAYGQVRRHFDFLTNWIAENNGSVVKTIGDAVMAVFHLPEDGFKAALQIQQHVAEFNRNHPDDITLKIGLYSGPAIAVNSNDRLDYFGRTVNLAARIQGQSIGNDIVFGVEYLTNQSIRTVLEKEDIVPYAFQAELKGIEGNVDLIRINI